MSDTQEYDSSSESDTEQQQELAAELERLKQKTKKKPKKIVPTTDPNVELVKPSKKKPKARVRKIYVDPDELEEQPDGEKIQIVYRRKKKGAPKKDPSAEVTLEKEEYEEVLDEGRPKKIPKMSKKIVKWNENNDMFETVKKHNPKAKQKKDGSVDERSKKTRTPAQIAAFEKCRKAREDKKRARELAKQQETSSTVKQTVKELASKLPPKVDKPAVRKPESFFDF